jgi:hypothetical protein
MTVPSPTHAPPVPPAPGGRGRLRQVAAAALEDKPRLGCGLVLAVLAFFVLRGIVPGLQGNRLPPALEVAIAETYRRCDEDFPIRPGDVRMPTCDVARPTRIGAGQLPANASAEGITSVVCYRVELERLFWGETGPQKHEMAWVMRTVSKVGVLQRGVWVLFPDEEQADAARWEDYGCPGEYESSTSLETRRS